MLLLLQHLGKKIKISICFLVQISRINGKQLAALKTHAHISTKSTP